LTIVNVTLLVFLGIEDFETRHWPLPSVVQDAVPPTLHEPLTIALAIGPWLLLWSVIVTRAVQQFCRFVLSVWKQGRVDTIANVASFRSVRSLQDDVAYEVPHPLAVVTVLVNDISGWTLSRRLSPEHGYSCDQ
jgi:hypothetical protein